MPDTENSTPNFHGNFCHGIDGSRRVMMPAKWRPADKQTIFRVLQWPIGANQYLLVLPPERWQVMLNKLKTKSLMDSRVAALERQLGATSAELTLDSAGRFCLPEHLARAANLDKEAQFVGRFDKFEIWSPERYHASVAADAGLAASLAKEIDL